MPITDMRVEIAVPVNHTYLSVNNSWSLLNYL
jgi:hypothetical protein